MLSTWKPTTTELDDFAKEHVEYEVRMLLQQFELLDLRQSDVDNASRTDLRPDGQALLEAVLVHLRLLDDFLGSRRQLQRRWSWRRPWRTRKPYADAFARHWDPKWEPSRVLSGAQRTRVDVMVAHLSATRTARPVWTPDNLLESVLKCSRLLDDFFARVGALDVQRLDAFRPEPPERDAPQQVKNFLSKWGP